MQKKMKKYEIFWVLLVPLFLIGIFKVVFHGIVYAHPADWDDARYIFTMLGTDASFMAVHFPEEFGEWIMWRLISWIAIVLLIACGLIFLTMNIIKIWKLLKKEKSIGSKEKKIR